ncbi:feruloyl-CoA synthase [Aquamicrobium sp. LC103]|uniref:feruloyl-CoA synthase n=1 Tax=Aquamicrobium sp. LC103 TaxID=1120658 RepID=UPI00063EC890|nr:feruloyl-CoA synthase [Aquamicrobium sp. LC103]TKT76734.1 feruloyl-CoA synthase [Aquamicrobium sp. LC103]
MSINRHDAVDREQENLFWSPRIESETRADRSIIIRQIDPLGPYPDRVTTPMLHWAEAAPDRVWMAQRVDGGPWRKVTYAEALARIRNLAQALIDLDLSAERPLLILSENDIEHALLALAAQHVGIPSAAIAPAYSLVSDDFAKLRLVRDQLTPGLLFAADGARYARAINTVFGNDVPLVSTRSEVEDRLSLKFEDLAAKPAGPRVDAAHEAITPDMPAKFLFTSGTTGAPKAVIQTHGMLCANQEMIADCYAFLRREPPVIVDWAPWNHTASGTKVFNMALFNGGTYYIDEGRPAAIGETIRNLREISPTWYFNVPAGYEALVESMESDPELRRSFFRRLRMMLYAGAGMSKPVWDRLKEMSFAETGKTVLLGSGLGATETSPFAMMCMEPQDMPGNIGVPARGVTLKLVPSDGRLEARIKGPLVTPGYWRDPELTAKAFDEEGFYRLGDALRYAVPGDAAGGFVFDGRIAENFKLQTGVWVAVGPLREELVNRMEGLVSDAVIVGEDREKLGAILIPFLPALRTLADAPADAGIDALARLPVVRDRIAERLNEHATAATGSASRIVKALFLDRPLSFDKGEVTDKGSVNQRAVRTNRMDLVEALYGDDPRVIDIRR